MANSGTRAAVYVHFPFCLRKCSYCDFFSQPVRRDQIPHDAYASAVLSEWSLRKKLLPQPIEAITLYFGGGTPSLWAVSALNRVIEEISEAVRDKQHDFEVTVECNPCSVDAAHLDSLRLAGVTRLSVGAQSFSPSRLHLLGRAHDGRRARETIEQARRAGFPSIGADVIFGLPGEKTSEALSDVNAAAQSGADHLSAYMLTVSPQTALARAMGEGSLQPIDDLAAAESFLAISDLLTSRGWGHYEVSNFALPGHESKHNLWVWRGGSYVGLGAGAVGCATLSDGRVVRVQNTKDSVRYIRAMQSADGDSMWQESESIDSVEVLSSETLLIERIMLGLRLEEGVDVEAAGQELGVTGWTVRRQRASRRLEASGRIERYGGRVRIPRRAWLWENDTTARLI